MFKELSYTLNGIFFKVHNDLGRFCRERQYADAIEQLLKEKELLFQREYPIPLGTDIGPTSNRVDFWVNNEVILELKAKPLISKDDYFQMRRYLVAAKCRLGLLVNFRNYRVTIKRVIVD